MKKALATITVALVLATGFASPVMAAKKMPPRSHATVSRVMPAQCPAGTRLVAIRYLPGAYVPGAATTRCI